jgi:hypothetical protein
MPDKMKRNRFGRQVTKSNYSFPGMDIPGAGSSGPGTVKSKSVRKGNTFKTRTVIKQDGKRTVNKTKKYETGDSSVTKSTARGGGGASRSVTTKSPGKKSMSTNMGPVKQARAYNYQVKKLKK